MAGRDVSRDVAPLLRIKIFRDPLHNLLILCHYS
jgi:hypothetical protein